MLTTKVKTRRMVSTVSIPKNDGGFSKEADSEDGWNGEADTREHRSKENIDGALQLIGQSGLDRAKRFGGQHQPGDQHTA